jgi:hypothetical protein
VKVGADADGAALVVELGAVLGMEGAEGGSCSWTAVAPRASAAAADVACECPEPDPAICR